MISSNKNKRKATQHLISFEKSRLRHTSRLSYEFQFLRQYFLVIKISDLQLFFDYYNSLLLLSTIIHRCTSTLTLLYLISNRLKKVCLNIDNLMYVFLMWVELIFINFLYLKKNSTYKEFIFIVHGERSILTVDSVHYY